MSAVEPETVARSDAEYRAQELSRHELTLLASNEAHGLSVYHLAKPGDSNHANVIVFSRYGIAIYGDTSFGDHDAGDGVTGARGKGPKWFAGDLSESYLAEKFLKPNKWSAELAAKSIHLEADEIDDAGEDLATRETLRAIGHDCDAGELGTPYELHERLQEDAVDHRFEGCPGYGYDENALGWLVAIQKRFAVLYAAQAQAQSARPSAPKGGPA